MLLFSYYMLHTYNRKYIPSKEQILFSTGENIFDLDSVAGLSFCQAHFAEETYRSYKKTWGCITACVTFHWSPFLRCSFYNQLKVAAVTK
jgi:hypothetical protein